MARYINPSCDANAHFRTIKLEADEDKEVVFVYAKRDFKLGEEVTVQFSWPYVDGLPYEKCECGNEDCSKFIGM